MPRKPKTPEPPPRDRRRVPDLPNDWDALPLALQVTEVARVLRCSARQVYRLLEKGELRGRPLGEKRVVISREEVREYLTGRPALQVSGRAEALLVEAARLLAIQAGTNGGQPPEREETSAST